MEHEVNRLTEQIELLEHGVRTAFGNGERSEFVGPALALLDEAARLGQAALALRALAVAVGCSPARRAA